jgi:type II secretory pathway pseudopilin PulG
MEGLIFLIIVSFIFLVTLKYLQNRINRQRIEEEIERKSARQKQLEHETIQERQRLKELARQRKIAEEQESFIKKSAEPLRYMFFDTSALDYNLSNLYSKVIKINRWINEPFHSKFFEFLVLFKDNEFMIIDRNTDVITMYVRDEDNVMQESKAYQVYSSKDIVVFVIDHVINDFDKSLGIDDIQDTLIAVIIITLMQSVHYLSNDATLNTIEKLTNNYLTKDNIENIVAQIKVKDSRYVSIQNAFEKAFLCNKTLPFNDGIKAIDLKFPVKLPKKYLQTI